MPRVFYSKCPIQQADAPISQANPVSATLYEWKDPAGNPLGTQKNVRIQSIITRVDWATTQPTPLDIVLTIDGITIVHSATNPVSATEYMAVRHPYAVEAAQYLPTATAGEFSRLPSFLYEGRSVKVAVRVTWATTQPTPLVLRVKWAKIP